MVAQKSLRQNFFLTVQSLTPRVSQVRKRLVPLDIGQHNAVEIFSVKRNIFSENSKVLLNYIFAEFDGSILIKE